MAHEFGAHAWRGDADLGGVAPETVVRRRWLSKRWPIIVGPIVGPVVERHASEHTGGPFPSNRGRRHTRPARPTMTGVGPTPPESGDDWVGLSAEPLPLEGAHAWAERSSCGAVVVFTGTVRDHAEGRAGVTSLEYEAYEEEARTRLAAIAAEVRRREPAIGRLVLLHRLGTLGIGETSVVVVVSAPHRAEAFESARFAIDTLKATVPIWKRETWAAGDDWSLASHPIDEVRSS